MGRISFSNFEATSFSWLGFTWNVTLRANIRAPFLADPRGTRSQILTWSSIMTGNQWFLDDNRRLIDFTDLVKRYSLSQDCIIILVKLHHGFRSGHPKTPGRARSRPARSG